MEQYTDNFELTPTDKIQNFRSMLTPGVLLGMNGPRTRGSALVSLGITQDSINRPGDLGYFPTVLAAVKHEFTPRFSVSLSDTFTRSDEPAVANQFGLQQARDTFTSNTMSLSADWLIDLFAVQAYYQLTTFFGTTNSISHIVGGNVGTPLGSLGALRGGYEFFSSNTTSSTPDVLAISSTGNLVWLSFARRLTAVSTVGVMASYLTQTLDNATIWNPAVFATYELPERFSVSAAAGFGYLTSDSGGDVPTFTANVSAAYRLGRAVFGLAIFQGFDQTFLEGENFGVTLTRSYTGTVGYTVTPTVEALLRASYSETQATGVGNTAATADSNTFTAQVGVAWRPRPWLTLGLDYTYIRSNTETLSGIPASGGVATANQVTFRLVGSF